jgi:hypothetical protein
MTDLGALRREIPLITLYHNPSCGTLRNTLGLIRNSGVEPALIECLKTTIVPSSSRHLAPRFAERPRQFSRFYRRRSGASFEKKTTNLLLTRKADVLHAGVKLALPVSRRQAHRSFLEARPPRPECRRIAFRWREEKRLAAAVRYCSET